MSNTKKKKKMNEKTVTGRCSNWIHINNYPGPNQYKPKHRTNTNHRKKYFSGKFNLAKPPTFIEQIQRNSQDVPGPITIQASEIQKYLHFTPKPMNGMDIVDMRFRMKEGTKPGSLPLLMRDLIAKDDVNNNKMITQQQQQHKNNNRNDNNRLNKRKLILERKKKKELELKMKEEEERLKSSVKINSLEDTFSLAQEQLDVFLPLRKEYDRYGREKQKKITNERWKLHQPFEQSMTTLNHYNGKY